MLACKICLVSLVVTSMLATTKSKSGAGNKINIGADIESSNVKPSSHVAPLANSSKPANFNMMKGLMNTSAKGIYSYNRKFLPYNVPTFEYEIICPCSFLGQRSYYFTAPPGALCADWSFPHIRQVGLCRTVLLGTNNNYGGTTRRPDYPNGCYLERGRPLGFLNTHAGSRTFSGMQWCGLRDKGKRYVYFLANNYANL